MASENERKEISDYHFFFSLRQSVVKQVQEGKFRKQPCVVFCLDVYVQSQRMHATQI